MNKVRLIELIVLVVVVQIALAGIYFGFSIGRKKQASKSEEYGKKTEQGSDSNNEAADGGSSDKDAGQKDDLKEGGEEMASSDIEDEVIVELDGGGSYVEVISGFVKAVSDADEEGYKFLMQLDDEYAAMLDADVVSVQMYYDWQHQVEDTFKEGDHVELGYMAGGALIGDPKLIESVNWANLIEENE